MYNTTQQLNTSTNYKCFTVVCDQYTDPPSTPSPEGLVYPPITDVTVSYTDSVDMTTVTACADLSTDDDSCSFNVSLTEDDSQPMYMFDVSVEVSNLGGSSVSQRTFESEKLYYVIQCYLRYLYSCCLSVCNYGALAFFAQSIKCFPALLENDNTVDK